VWAMYARDLWYFSKGCFLLIVFLIVVSMLGVFLKMAVDNGT
jgi:hypothetical protein